MPRKIGYPRNEASRRDRIAQHDIIHGFPRNHRARNDAIAGNPFGFSGTVLLGGTPFFTGVAESALVAGGKTIFMTLTGGDIWHSELGNDNPITDAMIAGFVGDGEGANDWDDEMNLTYSDIERTSDTLISITLPAAPSYSIGVDEIITIMVPGIALSKGQTPMTQKFLGGNPTFAIVAFT